MRDDARERRLAAPRRPEQDHRADAVLLDARAQRRTVAEDLALADELVQGLRPDPDRQRGHLRQPPARRFREQVAHDVQVCWRALATDVSDALREETVELLRELIRLDTVNPPGNETRAAELLRSYLEDNGVRCELFAKVPDRANLVARIPGGGGARLLLLSHTDTVLADASEWQVDPWSGELRDEHVWGRGALDMKGQVAASAVAIASLAREGFEPSGDLIFAATADEEVGEDFGLQWLVRAHPEAVRCEYALNEGAGDRLELGGRVLYLCSAAEKMSAPFTLAVHGRSGHASMPGIADNALVKAARLIERLDAYRPERTLGPETAAFLEVLTGERPTGVEEALGRARAIHPLAGDLVEPLLSLTLSPTMVVASRSGTSSLHAAT